jgi:hypothetical protein
LPSLFRVPIPSENKIGGCYKLATGKAAHAKNFYVFGALSVFKGVVTDQAAWELLELSVAITRLIAAGHVFTEARALEIQELIERHHRQFIAVFPGTNHQGQHVVPNFHYILHLADALRRYGSAAFVSANAFERLHSFSKACPTNNRSLDWSILRHWADAQLKLVRTRIEEEHIALANGTWTTMIDGVAASQFHGEVHPALYCANATLQHQINVDSLPARLALEWPVQMRTCMEWAPTPSVIESFVAALSAAGAEGSEIFHPNAVEATYTSRAILVCRMASVIITVLFVNSSSTNIAG